MRILAEKLWRQSQQQEPCQALERPVIPGIGAFSREPEGRARRRHLCKFCLAACTFFRLCRQDRVWTSPSWWRAKTPWRKISGFLRVREVSRPEDMTR